MHLLSSFAGMAAHAGWTAADSVLGRFDGVLVGRMVWTLLLCGAVVLERSTHERASGFRTHILVGLAACLMTLAGGYGFRELHTAGDPMRIASYVVSGIGFLGAGAILRHGTTVRGLTTAASLWSAAGVGLTVGVGLGWLATVSVLLILFTLAPLQKWEARLSLGTRAGELAIHLREAGKPVGRVLTLLGQAGITVRRATVLPGAGAGAVLRVELGAALTPDELHPLVERLLAHPDVVRVHTAPAAGGRTEGTAGDAGTDPAPTRGADRRPCAAREF